MRDFRSQCRAIGPAKGAASAAKLPFKVLDERVETASGQLSICTMHLAKGLEFLVVAVMACDDELIPLQEWIEADDRSTFATTHGYDHAGADDQWRAAHAEPRGWGIESFLRIDEPELLAGFRVEAGEDAGDAVGVNLTARHREARLGTGV